MRGACAFSSCPRRCSTAAGASTSQQPATCSVSRTAVRGRCVNACGAAGVRDGSRAQSRSQRLHCCKSSLRNDSGADATLPTPSTSGRGDTELHASLRRNRYWSQCGHGLDLLSSGRGLMQRLPQIYVILFGVNPGQEEGIYSLRALGPDGMPQDTVVAFESKDDAERYACLLEAAMEHWPHVYSIPATELYDFCLERAYRCRLELKGTLLSPPDYNVGVTDWERSSKLRSGHYAVLTVDPQVDAAGQPSSAHTAQAVQAAFPSSTYLQQAVDGGLLGLHQLAAIRCQLEALLPSDSETDSETDTDGTSSWEDDLTLL